MTEGRASDHRLSRRRFLRAALGGAAALALPARAWAGASAAARRATRGVWSYVTAPGLAPPTLTVTTLRSPSPGHLFVTTLNGPGQRGPMILDDRGHVLWFRPVTDVAINFRRQAYRGKPVLTWWEGKISQAGVGQGENLIADDTYTVIARVRAGNGFQADVHECLLTPQGTALITAYTPVPADLRPVGGPASGTALDSIVQEVDIASGRVLFEWHSIDHVPIGDSYAPLLDPYDYFHVNSVDVDHDGNLIVSARSTSAIYKLDRKSGAVLWRLGGRSSDFALGAGFPFMYQHDARIQPDGALTLFDDGPSSASAQSRVLRLHLDPTARTAEIVKQYVHPTPIASVAMGNAQFRPDGHVVVGWGTEPYVSEFDAAGAVVFDATFDGGGWNYRAFRDAWVGRPKTRPAVAVRRTTKGLTVHASWNGSTETAYWRVLGGPGRTRLEPIKRVPRTGFETTILLGSKPRLVAVQALDARRRVLATSAAVAHG